jgi:hypothetical protein
MPRGDIPISRYALGDVFVDDGNVYEGNCSGKLYGGACADGDQKLAVNNVLVSGVGERVALYCCAYAGTKLILPNGDYAFPARSMSLQI